MRSRPFLGTSSIAPDLDVATTRGSGGGLGARFPRERDRAWHSRGGGVDPSPCPRRAVGARIRAPRHIPCHGQRPRRALDVVAIRGPLPDQPGFLAADDDLESPAPPASYRGDLLATRHTERQPGSEPRTVADLEPCRPGVL